MEIEDKLAIHELMARYSFALDFGDVEGWVNCFTEDGVFEGTFGTHAGSKALRKYATDRSGERQEHPLRHLVTNSLIDVQGDRASAKSYFLLLRVSLPEGIQILTTGVYADELQRIGGSWRFRHRKTHVDSEEFASQVFPASYLQKSKG